MSNALIPTGWLDGGERARSFSEPEPNGAEATSLLKLALDLLALVRRNLLIVLGMTVVVVGIAVFQVSRQVPIYQALAVVRVADRSPLSAQATARGQMISQSTLLSKIQILQSRAVAREVVEQEGLRLTINSQTTPANWRDFLVFHGTRAPAAGWIEHVRVDSNVTARSVSLAFAPTYVILKSDGPELRLPYGVPFDGGGLHFTVAKNPGVAQIRLTVTSLDDAVGTVLSSLRARAREGTDILDVTYRDIDPIRAQRIANMAVQSFQGLEAKTAKQASVRRRQFMEQQLRKTETLLAEAELAQNTFRTRAKVYNSQEQLRTQQTDLTSLEMRRQELVTDRKQLMALQQALAQPRRAGMQERLNLLAASPIVATNATLGQVYNLLAQQHATRDSMTTGSFARSLQDPDVRRLDAVITSTDARLTGAVGAQIAAVDARLQALDEITVKTTEKLATLPQAEAKETGLLSQTETYRKEAERLRDQVLVAQIDEAAEAGQIEIIDLAALPRSPMGSGRTPRLVFALMLGLGLGTVIAYVIENHKSVIRNRGELERAIPVANLALIPQIKAFRKTTARQFARTKKGEAAIAGPGVPEVGQFGNLVTMYDNSSTSAEAYRTLRTNLLFSASRQFVRRLIVTSASPKEGKSITAANLAVAFAQQGQRVLLIDCDLRRPALHKVFSIRQRPGLTEVLNGEVVLAAAILKTAIPNLCVLPAGAISTNPSELLGGSTMLVLLDSLSANYDTVLIDTPPLLAASDAAILSKIADGVLVVVRAGMTERAAVQEGMYQLVNVGACILGTVLNDPDAEVAKYAPYYHEYYNNYYAYPSSDK